MTHQNRSIYFSLLSTFLVCGGFLYIVCGMYDDGAFTGPDAFRTTGKSILWFMGALVVVRIVVEILGSIIAGIALGVKTGGEYKIVVDERDKKIEFFGMQVAVTGFGITFIGSMIALASGWPPVQVFHMIILTGALGTIVGDLTMLWRYRRGY